MGFLRHLLDISLRDKIKDIDTKNQLGAELTAEVI
jgi:hypothetical protein